jgi:hypothetical protein
MATDTEQRWPEKVRLKKAPEVFCGVRIATRSPAPAEEEPSDRPTVYIDDQRPLTRGPAREVSDATGQQSRESSETPKALPQILHMLASTIGRARLAVREPTDVPQTEGELRDAAEAVEQLRRYAAEQPHSDTERLRERLKGQAALYLESCRRVIEGSTGEYDWKEKYEATGQREAYNRIVAALDQHSSEGGEG